MKRLILAMTVAIPSVSTAGFLVSEEASAPAVIASPIVSNAPIVSSKAVAVGVAKGGDVQAVPARVTGVQAKTASVFGQVRTIVRHKGRKPAVYGKPVATQSTSTTLSALVADVMPEQFQAFASDEVDMNIPVKGGASPNWIEAITTALRDSNYVATVDWDKKEVMFDIDKGDPAAVVERKKMAQKRKQWEVKLSDGILSQVLARWCKDSDGECVNFVNQSTKDLVIEGEMTTSGDFRSAVSQLMMAADPSGRVFQWRLSPNKVLILSNGTSVEE
jgi:hypothetical protein